MKYGSINGKLITPPNVMGIGYTTNITVHYQDIVNNIPITTKQVNEEWDNNDTVDQLKLDIPDGYSDQISDFIILVGNYNTKNVLENLGLQSMRIKNNQIYCTYNVVPKACTIKVVYTGPDNEIEYVSYLYGTLGSKFSPQNLIPKNSDSYNIVSSPTEYTNNEQTCLISYTPPANPSTDYIDIEYREYNQDHDKLIAVAGMQRASGKDGSDFDINNYINNVPQGYSPTGQVYNPQAITKFAKTNGNSPVIYVIVTRNATQYSTISVDYVDADSGDEISEYNYEGEVGTDFNITQCLNPIKNYSFVTIKNDIGSFKNYDQTVEVLMRAIITHQSEIQVNPPSTDQLLAEIGKVPYYNFGKNGIHAVVPGSAYILYVDEDYDASENPESYPSPTDDEFNPQPLSNVIRKTSNPVQLPDLNHIRYGDIYYNHRRLGSDTLIPGPHLNWTPFYYTEEYPNMYLYEIDTAKDLRAFNIKGNNYVAIACYPAYVKGVSFQLCHLNKDKTVRKIEWSLPQNKSVNALPKNWSYYQSPITKRLYFEIPYGEQDSAFALAHIFFGASRGKIRASNGKVYQIAHDRSIQFTIPYDYEIALKR